MGLDSVSHVILILSGKGGVGKSSVTLQLALALTNQGHNVGILDIDLTGPSIPRLLNLENKKVTQAPGGWLPVKVHDSVEGHSLSMTNGRTTEDLDTNGHISNPENSSSLLSDPTELSSQSTQQAPNRRRGSLHALSLAFLLPSRSSAVIWRGPKKTAMIRQFVSDVLWPPGTDYILIDTPPGTSDEHIAIVEELHKLATSSSDLPPPSGNRAQSLLAGAVVVTTPQAISTADVRKELNFCTKTAVPVLGVIENMAGYICPCCGEVSNVFSKGGGQIMATECNVPFLGSVPIDIGFGAMVEGVPSEGEAAEEDGNGVPVTAQKKELVDRYRECGLSPIFDGFAKKIVQDVEG